MKTRGRPFLALPAVLLVALAWPAGAGAQSRHTWTPTWGIGLRGGPAIYTQDAYVATAVTDTLSGKMGPAVSGVVFYKFHRYFAFGLDFGWEQHKLEEGALDWGKASAISLMPRLELHMGSSWAFDPYLFFGAGYNFNSFSESDEFKDQYGDDVKVELGNDFGATAGLGADLFLLSERFGLNFEIGWKFNRSELRGSGGNLTGAVYDLKAHSLNVLIGFRYHFSPDPFH